MEDSVKLTRPVISASVLMVIIHNTMWCIFLNTIDCSFCMIIIILRYHISLYYTCMKKNAFFW